MVIDQWQPKHRKNQTQFAAAQRDRDWLTLMRKIKAQWIASWIISISGSASPKFDPLKPYTWPSL